VVAMLIHEVSKKCSLTKKAIEYYEKQGLVHPEFGDNGYRTYCENDLCRLKEISVLRSLGLGISDIRKILASKNKPIALSKYSYVINLKKQKMIEQQKWLELLIEHYDIDQALEYIDSNLKRLFSIKEKLVQSFPGTYGVYLSIHFGPFLNEKIDSAEKETAYTKIVDFLDHLKLTDEMEKCIEHTLSLVQTDDMENIIGNVQNIILNDTENYIENHQDNIDEYIKFRTSEEYKSTPAYKMQQVILEFQRNSGYYDIFIPNLKILSHSYREYSEKLQKANQLFMERFPQTTKIYPEHISMRENQ
jgi:DNA-binding transcriptional MerR regulator